MAGDDLSAIAGLGLMTQDDRMAEADAAISEMADLLCETVAEMHSLALGDHLEISIMRHNGKLLGVILSPVDITDGERVTRLRVAQS